MTLLPMNGVQSVTPAELKRRLDAGEAIVLLDVREPEELALAHLEAAKSIPLGDLETRVGELDPEQAIVCICHHGIRSAHAAQFLKRHGFREVGNLSGGVDRWAVEVDPSMKRYR
jgi:rhodanese-related sulfurtransferase